MDRSGILYFWPQAVEWLSAHAVVPMFAWLHLQNSGGNPRQIAEAVLVAVTQLAVIALVFRPLESVLPAERWMDRKLTRVDIEYSVINLLGLFPLFGFLILTPLANRLGVGSSAGGEESISLLHLTHWVPALDKYPLMLFLAYYVIYDFVYYGVHRLQHAVPWWWALHSLHHSQRQVSCWTDDRDSYLDGALQAVLLATAGLLIGVAPNEFAAMVMLGELVQKFSHANVRVGFGPLLGKILVGPRYHRLHHMRANSLRPTLHNCNFSQVFPVWDIVFGTALYDEPPHSTGVSDPVVDADNSHGLIVQQWMAVRRFWGALWQRSGWIPGDVSFGAGYVPIPNSQAQIRAVE